MSRWKSTVFFMVALALAYSLLVWNKEGDLSSRLGTQRILSTYEADLKSLVFTGGTNQIVFSINESGDWQVGEEPNQLIEADETMVESLLNELISVRLDEGFTLKKMRERGFTLADYGFDMPEGSLALDRSGEETVWIWGSQSSLDKAQYVMKRGGKRVYTIDDGEHRIFPERAEDFYEYKIFIDSIEHIDRVELGGSAADGFIQLLRNGNRGWQLTQPRLGSVEESDFLTLMEMLSRVQLESFVEGSAEDASSFGFDEPYLRLSVSSVENGMRVFQVGDASLGDDTFRYATQSGTGRVGLLETGLVEKLIESIEKLRASQVFEMRGSSLSYCHIYDHVREIKLGLDSNQVWRVEKSFDRLVAASVINELREFIEGMVITRFDVEPNPNSARVNMEVCFGDRTYSEEITCLVPLDLDAPVQIQFVNENKVHEVNRVKPLFDWLNPLAYMQRALFDEDWQLSRIDRILEGVTNRMARVTEEGEPGGVVGSAVEFSQWSSVADDLIKLHAESYVVSYPPALDVFQLDDPVCRLLFYERAQAWHTKELLIGGVAPAGGRYAMLKGHELIFILSEASVRTCMMSWKDNPSSNREE